LLCTLKSSKCPRQLLLLLLLTDLLLLLLWYNTVVSSDLRNTRRTKTNTC
jgi:hypothetical protein